MRTITIAPAVVASGGGSLLPEKLQVATRRRLRPMLAGLVSSLLAAASQDVGYAQELSPQSSLRLIGATATVTEGSSGLPFMARVDTGATTCSIHCEEMEIADSAADPKENIGKPIRFLVKNKRGQAEWLEAVIIDHVTVRTSNQADQRYKVQLELRWQDVEKSVHVTLHDRQHMKYPVLIGRNFLRDEFLVNVSWDHSE